MVARRCHHGHARNSGRPARPGLRGRRPRSRPSQEVTCPARGPRHTRPSVTLRPPAGVCLSPRQVFSDLDWVAIKPGKAAANKAAQNMGRAFRQISYQNASAHCFRRDMLTGRRGDGPVRRSRRSLWQGTGSSHEHGRPLHEQRDWAPRHLKAGSTAPSAIRPVPGMRRPACRHGRRPCDGSRRACQPSRGSSRAWAASAPAGRRDSVLRLPDLRGGPSGLRRLVRGLHRGRDRRRSRLLMPRPPGAGPATSRVTAPGGWQAARRRTGAGRPA
jgi:hypothetical protein